MVEHVLAPTDGSKNADRALRFAAELATRYGADIDVVHITDVETADTRAILDEARELLAEAGIEEEPTVRFDLQLTFKAGDRVGADILRLVEEEGYDHVVMGHHGAGAAKRLVLGSATETVIRADEVPVTVIP